MMDQPMSWRGEAWRGSVTRKFTARPFKREAVLPPPLPLFGLFGTGTRMKARQACRSRCFCHSHGGVAWHYVERHGAVQMRGSAN